MWMRRRLFPFFYRSSWTAIMSPCSCNKNIFPIELNLTTIKFHTEWFPTIKPGELLWNKNLIKTQNQGRRLWERKERHCGSFKWYPSIRFSHSHRSSSVVARFVVNGDIRHQFYSDPLRANDEDTRLPLPLYLLWNIFSFLKLPTVLQLRIIEHCVPVHRVEKGLSAEDGERSTWVNMRRQKAGNKTGGAWKWIDQNVNVSSLQGSVVI